MWLSFVVIINALESSRSSIRTFALRFCQFTLSRESLFEILRAHSDLLQRWHYSSEFSNQKWFRKKSYFARTALVQNYEKESMNRGIEACSHAEYNIKWWRRSSNIFLTKGIASSENSVNCNYRRALFTSNHSSCCGYSSLLLLSYGDCYVGRFPRSKFLEYRYGQKLVINIAAFARLPCNRRCNVSHFCTI